MPSHPVSLPTELLENIVQQLSIEDARNLLLSCKTMYKKGKQAFDETCFRTIPVIASEAGIRQAEDLLDNEYCRCLETISIFIDSEDWDVPQSRLASVLAKGRQVSTKLDTIRIYDNPKRRSPPGWLNFLQIKAAILSLPKDTRPLKVQLRNIRLYYTQNLDINPGFLELVESIDLRFDQRPRTSITHFERSLSLARNLRELSLIVNSDKTLSSKIVRRITESIRSETFQKLTIHRVLTSKRHLQRILTPLKGSIKEIILEAVTFKDHSFVDFLGYIQDNFSLDYICLKDVWEDDEGEGYKVLDRAEFYKEDIRNGLSTLKTRYPQRIIRS
jgi:hypothetical protein